MSNSTPTPSRGTGADDDTRFTVEDAGTTTDPTDLFQNDTTAGTSGGTSGGASVTSTADEDPVASADSVAAVAAGSDSSTGSAPRDDSRPKPVARAQVTTSATTGSSSDSPDSPTAPGAPEAPSAPTGLAALIGDDSIGHVFDQTNGIIEGVDGDSDGTADSDTRSGAERADENPASLAYADTEAPSSADTDDTRRTGN